MKYLFYDTCSLLLKNNSLFEDQNEKPIISSITINELEGIKTSINKDETVRAQARAVLRQLNDNIDKYEIVLFNPHYLEFIDNSFDITNDLKILACANYYNLFVQPIDYFITNDLILKQLALMYFKTAQVKSIGEDEDDYTGFIELYLNDIEIANFYNNYESLPIQPLLNQYIILKNTNGEVFDYYKYTKNGLERIACPTFNSYQFGQIKPKDVYQLVAMDSMLQNKVTLIGGHAGTGKTYLALSALFHLMDKNAIDRIVVFCNPVVARGAAKLGFYPGTREEKLLGSSVGEVLSSKLGDSSEVIRLIESGRLTLIPVGDSRGYEVPPHSGVYIMESQNLDITLLKLLLQRISEDSIVIVDGDRKTQTDMAMYAGENNGMKRMSKVFRGNELFGQVDLQNIYRSKIAELADQM